MIIEGLTWIERRTRPAEGWLPLLLLLAIIMVLTIAVDGVGWVPEGSIVYAAGFAGLFLGVILARRPIGWLGAWLLIMAYGLVLTTIWLGRLAPPLLELFAGRGAFGSHVRSSWELLLNRAGSWITAVQGGGSSQETIVFAFGLGLLAWLVAAYAGWATFRQRRPWAGLTVLTLALAANTFYGRADVWIVPIFVGLLLALVAIVQYMNREASWASRKVDYSTEIRLELLVYSGVIALTLFFLATALPSIRLRTISRALLSQPAVVQAEEALERVFAGVRQPAQRTPADDDALLSGGVGQGMLPRSFLLGAPPELYETVVMTATTQGESSRISHWRGFSYDHYTGQGWALSPESRAHFAAGQEIPLPPITATTTISQAVTRADDAAIVRFTLGMPERFSSPVTVYWRDGGNDLSRVEGQGRSYTAASQASTASAAEVRGASLADAPPALMVRYSQLPDSVPERVLDLAQQVAGWATTPYDQAKALETFLRQYPYSLDVELPPAGRDPVDYFLFDLQAGYCDYYASAMVVMARSLGLPARLAGGYLAQPAVDGVQTIRQLNAHSWAEVYFPGYGWLEFEPTAAFPAETLIAAPGEQSFFDSEAAVRVEPPPIPEPQADRRGALWLLALVPLLLGSWWLWRIYWPRRFVPADQTAWAYQQLQRRASRLGQAVQPSQTPAEFSDAFLAYLNELDQGRLARRLQLAHLAPEVRQLTSTFAVRQYGRRKPPASQAVDSWRRIRRQLWLLNLVEDLRGLWPFQ